MQWYVVNQYYQLGCQCILKEASVFKYMHEQHDYIKYYFNNNEIPIPALQRHYHVEEQDLSSEVAFQTIFVIAPKFSLSSLPRRLLRLFLCMSRKPKRSQYACYDPRRLCKLYQPTIPLKVRFLLRVRRFLEHLFDLAPSKLLGCPYLDPFVLARVAIT